VKRQNKCANRGTKLFPKNVACAMNGTSNIFYAPQNIESGSKLLWKCILRPGTGMSHNEPQAAHNYFKKITDSIFIYNANIMINMKFVLMHLWCDVCGSSKETKTNSINKKG
jgi:hypothetical protein